VFLALTSDNTGQISARRVEAELLS
jgi:hypothetical protein